MSLRDEMRLIETTHLKTWASSKPAESTFPYISNSSPPVLIVTMIPFGCMAPRSKGRCPLPDVYRVIAQ
jgi:hypothetical protein